MRTVYQIKCHTQWWTWPMIEARVAAIPGAAVIDIDRIEVDDSCGRLGEVIRFLESLGYVSIDDPVRGTEALMSQETPDYYVLHLHVFTEADRLAAPWLWYRCNHTESLEGEFVRGEDGRLRGNGVHVPRPERIVKGRSDHLFLTEAARLELGPVGLAGIELRGVEVESWRDGIGQRGALWEVVPRVEMPPMPAGRVTRRWGRARIFGSSDPTARYGPLLRPGFDDGLLCYTPAQLAAIEGLDAAWSWEREREDYFSPFLLISQRFYREVIWRYQVECECRPVRVVDGPVPGVGGDAAATPDAGGKER